MPWLSSLPDMVVAMRMHIFARVNGNEGIAIPGPLVDVEHFRAVYAHPAANGRSEGAGLSDLFWYWLAPGPHVHQEHLEAGARYDAVARTTRRFLARPKHEMIALAEQCARRTLEEIALDRHGMRTVRLRDLMMPLWADFYYELVFGEACPAEARSLIVAHANDVVTALKCCGLRHMGRRQELTQYLARKIESTGLAETLPIELSAQERVWYLQGTFFNTAIVQMSEAMTHLLMTIAQHPSVQRRLVDEPGDDAYLDRVIDETFRCFPLFGIAHRITTDRIRIDEDTELPPRSVVCFNYPAYHSTGFDHPERFDPDRWLKLSSRDCHHIPFGMTGNRPCPARGVAPLTMRVVAREMLRRFELDSTASHIRSIPNRGPCLVARRGPAVAARLRDRALQRMSRSDQWEALGRSVLQLVLGTYMVLDARHKRLAGRYFDRPK